MLLCVLLHLLLSKFLQNRSPNLTSIAKSHHCNYEIISFINNLAITVNCPSQETEVTSTPTRPVENFVITTKGIQDRNNLLLDGRTVENKGKLILTEIFPSVQKHDI